MEQNLKSPADKQAILNWLKSGKTKINIDVIAPILNRDCVVCHNPQSNSTLPNLTSYEGVMKVADSKGAAVPAPVKITALD
ncbi:MAG: hypothetical protein ACXWTL_09570 [Methylobacter sp.]